MTTNAWESPTHEPPDDWEPLSDAAIRQAAWRLERALDDWHDPTEGVVAAAALLTAHSLKELSTKEQLNE